MRLGVVGVERDGLALAGRRLVQAVQFVKRIAQVAMIGGGGGVVSDGLPDQFHGGSVIADLMGDDAEQMQGDRLVGVSLQDLLVEALGLRQATRSVMLQSEVQGLLDGGALLLFRNFFSALPNEDRCE